MATSAWSVRWMIIDTAPSQSGRKVIVSPKWIKNLNWSGKEVEFDAPLSQIERAPEFDDRLPLSRDYEGRLYDYYGRPRDWSSPTT
jgi:hypothetical protein